MDKKKLLLFIILGAGTFLVYKKMSAKRVSLSGASDRVVDSILPWVNINPLIKPLVSGVAKEFLRGLNE